MKNSSKSKAKKSKVELKTNKYILITILLQAICCLIAAAYSTVWQKNYSENATYLELEEGEN